MGEQQRRLLRDMGIEYWHLRSDSQSKVVEPAPPTVAPSQQPTPPASTPATDPPYAVVALGAPGALLVVEAFENRGDDRLARDIVRTACADWSAPVGQARFDWPLPGATGSSAPVLAAFVEKQVEDHAANRVLIAESALSRLGAYAEEFIAVPDLASLADVEAKTALWLRLRG